MRRISRMWARERPPWRSAFSAQRALPASVRGPVEWRHGLSRRATAAWSARRSGVQSAFAAPQLPPLPFLLRSSSFGGRVGLRRTGRRGKPLGRIFFDAQPGPREAVLKRLRLRVFSCVQHSARSNFLLGRRTRLAGAGS